MTEPEVQFELVEFEQVEAAPGTALLRIAGRPAAGMPAGPLTLVIEAGGAEHRHEQLPALPGPAGLVRAAFSAPDEHVGTGSSFSLGLPDGELVPLPAPTRGRASLAPFTGHELLTTLGAETSQMSEPGAGESSRLIESDLGHLRTEREAARAQLDAALADRDEALADRDEALADRDEAEARARAAAANAGTLEAQIRAAADTATRAQAALEAQLADRAAELERVRAAAELAQARAHASRRELTMLDEQLAHAQAQIAVLTRALAEPARHQDSALASALSELDAALAGRTAEVELLREALRLEREKRTRAEEALVSTAAQQTLTAESLALEARRFEH